MELNFKLIEDAIPLLLAGAGITLERAWREKGGNKKGEEGGPVFLLIKGGVGGREEQGYGK